MKGHIKTTHTIHCACGYEEMLSTWGMSDPTYVAKRNGWTWDVEEGWQCPHHIQIQLADPDMPSIADMINRLEEKKREEVDVP